MEEKFIIDDGSKTYVFESKDGEEFARIKFNPADTGMVARYDKVANFFKNYKYPEQSDDLIQAVMDFDEAIKEQFAFLFNRDVSGLFERYTPTAIFANGDFYCEVILDYVGQVIESELNVRLKEKKARIKRATAKYHK